jgi:hypothetical protein
MVEPKLDYNVSVVLYGRAVQARNESRALRISSANDAVSRMQDCAILAIVLSHATLESAWHWELQAARIGPQPSWPGGLENGIRRVAESRRRSIPPGIPTRHRSDFSLLCAWRNYLRHADAGARRRIAERLGEEFHRHLGPTWLNGPLRFSILMPATSRTPWVASYLDLQSSCGRAERTAYTPRLRRPIRTVGLSGNGGYLRRWASPSSEPESRTRGVIG